MKNQGKTLAALMLVAMTGLSLAPTATANDPLPLPCDEDRGAIAQPSSTSDTQTFEGDLLQPDLPNDQGNLRDVFALTSWGTNGKVELTEGESDADLSIYAALPDGGCVLANAPGDEATFSAVPLATAYYLVIEREPGVISDLHFEGERTLTA